MEIKEKILVIKLSALGDFILALGAMAAIRQHHPKAHITLLTTRLFQDMAERSRYFDKVVVFPRPQIYEVQHWYNLFRFFNQGNFARVYDLQLNGRTNLYYKMFLKKPEWSGVIKGAPLFYPNKNWRAMHAFKRHQEILQVAGIDVHIPDISWMTSDISLFKIKAPYVVFIPGSAPTHPEKRWPAVRYGALGMKLMKDGYQIVVIGTAAEADVIERVRKACPEIVNLAGKTSLYDVATLARGAAGIVGNDTGPTHLAALTGSPTLALFCTAASRPEYSAPIGRNVQIIQADDLEDVSVSDVYNNFMKK